MSRTSCKRCRFPLLMRWLHAGDDLSRPNTIQQCADRALMLSEHPPKCLPHSADLPYVQTHVQSCHPHVYHRGRRPHQIPIALAA